MWPDYHYYIYFYNELVCNAINLIFNIQYYVIMHKCIPKGNNIVKLYTYFMSCLPSKIITDMSQNMSLLKWNNTYPNNCECKRGYFPTSSLNWIPISNRLLWFMAIKINYSKALFLFFSLRDCSIGIACFALFINNTLYYFCSCPKESHCFSLDNMLNYLTYICIVHMTTIIHYLS